MQDAYTGPNARPAVAAAFHNSTIQTLRSVLN
jgi:hypothetical protein